MKTSTIVRSPVALALGIFFAGVTARVILDDVWQGAPVTLSHVNSVAALIGAISAGHFILPVLKKAQIAAAIGLALIFTAATGYIVISSGARNAEAMQGKAASIQKDNDERTAARAKLAEAETDLAEAKGDLEWAKNAFEKAKTEAAKECKSGDGTRCKGSTKTRDAASIDFEKAAKAVEKADGFVLLKQATITRIGPEHEVNGGYKHAARVFEAAGFGKADDIEKRIELLLPFATVLISEIGTLTFLGMAIGHRPARLPANNAAPANVPTFAKPKGPQGPKGKRKTSPQFPANVVPISGKHPVIAALENVGGTIASNRELARLMRVTDGEATKRVAEVAHLLTIKKIGKAVTISLRQAVAA
jgi:hypothetical protein